MSRTAILRLVSLVGLLLAPDEVRVGAQAPSWVEAESTLVIQYGRVEPSTRPLTVHDSARPSLLIESDRQLLLKSLKTGLVTLSASDATRITPFQSVRVIILFSSQPLLSTVRLRQPESSTVLYVQDGEAFTQYPADAKFSTRTIDLTPSTARSDVFLISFDLPLGAKSGGSVYIRK